ncbi:MAG: hypothetical protein ACFB3T_06985 [Geminicoccaceae bacterium]
MIASNLASQYAADVKSVHSETVTGGSAGSARQTPSGTPAALRTA